MSSNSVVYKIRNKETSMFSTGGSNPRWKKVGKTWSGLGPVTNHLAMWCDKYDYKKRGRIIIDIPDEWEIVGVETLGDRDLKYIPTEATSPEVQLGQPAIEEAQVVSLPFCGGSATTVKKKIGAHKLVHKALHVKVEKAGKKVKRPRSRRCSS